MSGGSYEASPEEKLADLMNRDLGTRLQPREIRMFIRANWRKVSAYSHAIHCSEGQRQKPDDFNQPNPKADRCGY